MAAAPVDPDDFRMSFGDHLEELRTRMVRGLAGVVLAAVLTYTYGGHVISWLTEPLNREQIAAGLPPMTVTNTVTAGFFTYIKVTIISALIISSPWILYQAWKFVSAGLYSHERKIVYTLAPFSAIMTVAAVTFMYYIMLPVALKFLLFFAVSFGPAGGQSTNPFEFLSSAAVPGATATEDPAIKPETPATNLPELVGRIPQLETDPAQPAAGQLWVNTKQNALKIRVGDRILVAYLAVSSVVSPLIDLAQYIDFVMFMTLGIAIAFQAPVAMYVIGRAGVARSEVLARYRKHVFFVCFCLGAVLTPSSDPLSMTVLASALYFLFELGLVLMRLTQRDVQEEDDDEWDDDDDDEDEEEDEEDEQTVKA